MRRRGTAGEALRRSAGICVAAAAVALSWAAWARQPADEPPPALKTATVLDPAQRSGPLFRVEDTVQTPEYYHVFTIASDFGPMEAIGRSQLAVRIQEVSALAALRDVSKSDVFLQAAGQSLVKVGQGVAKVATDPEATAKGIGSGVKRFGVNLGRHAKRSAESVMADDAQAAGDTTPGQPETNAAAGVAKSVAGVNAAMRRWAQKVGADPYTTNPLLRESLDAIAQVDAAGALVTKIAVPVPAVVSTTASVGNLVWGKDPEELRKINEARVRELGVGEQAAKAFFRNRSFTPTSQTRLVAALHAVRRPGCADYLESATDAAHEREALFFVESAEMLRTLHERSSVAAVLADSRVLVAKGPDGTAVALLPLDWVRDTDTAKAVLRETAQRVRTELGGNALRIRVTGQVTARASRAFAALGWVAD